MHSLACSLSDTFLTLAWLYVKQNLLASDCCCGPTFERWSRGPAEMVMARAAHILPHIRLFKNQWVTSQCSVHYSIYSLWISVPWIHVLISQYMLKGASAHLTEWQRAPSSIVTSLVRSVTIPLLTTLLSSSSRVWWRIHCHTWHIHKHVLGIYS